MGFVFSRLAVPTDCTAARNGIYANADVAPLRTHRMAHKGTSTVDDALVTSSGGKGGTGTAAPSCLKSMWACFSESPSARTNASGGAEFVLIDGEAIKGGLVLAHGHVLLFTLRTWAYFSAIRHLARTADETATLMHLGAVVCGWVTLVGILFFILVHNVSSFGADPSPFDTHGDATALEMRRLRELEKLQADAVERKRQRREARRIERDCRAASIENGSDSDNNTHGPRRPQRDDDVGRVGEWEAQELADSDGEEMDRGHFLREYDRLQQRAEADRSARAGVVAGSTALKFQIPVTGAVSQTLRFDDDSEDSSGSDGAFVSVDEAGRVVTRRPAILDGQTPARDEEGLRRRRGGNDDDEDINGVSERRRREREFWAAQEAEERRARDDRQRRARPNAAQRKKLREEARLAQEEQGFVFPGQEWWRIPELLEADPDRPVPLSEEKRSVTAHVLIFLLWVPSAIAVPCEWYFWARDDPGAEQHRTAFFWASLVVGTVAAIIVPWVPYQRRIGRAVEFRDRRQGQSEYSHLLYGQENGCCNMW